MSFTNLVQSLPPELKNNILLYLKNENNLFFYIYDYKKQTLLRKVNKQNRFLQKILHFKINYSPFIFDNITEIWLPNKIKKNEYELFPKYEYIIYNDSYMLYNDSYMLDILTIPNPSNINI